jgi:hypothetical protein
MVQVDKGEPIAIAIHKIHLRLKNFTEKEDFGSNNSLHHRIEMFNQPQLQA